MPSKITEDKELENAWHPHNPHHQGDCCCRLECWRTGLEVLWVNRVCDNAVKLLVSLKQVYLAQELQRHERVRHH